MQHGFFLHNLDASDSLLHLLSHEAFIDFQASKRKSNHVHCHGLRATSGRVLLLHARFERFGAHAAIEVRKECLKRECEMKLCD